MNAEYLENIWNRKKNIKFVYKKWWNSIANYMKNNDIVLEIGCGNGFFYEYLKKHKKVRYIGIDASKDNIYLARKKGNYFILGSAERLPFKSFCIDVIVGIDVLHHLNFNKAIKEASRVLKNNGILLAVEPNKTKFNTFLTKIFRFHEDYTKYPSIGDIKEVMEKNHFDVIEIEVRDSLIYPLSGGFSRKNLIPQKFIGFIDFFDEKLLSKLKFLCWKFIIKARKVDLK